MESPETRFKTNISDLCMLIKDISLCAQEKGCNALNIEMIDIASKFLEGLDNHMVISSFISYSFTNWDMIKAKEKDFFTVPGKADSMFRNLPVGGVDALRVLFTYRDKNGNLVIEQEDIDIIWDYLHALVKISIKYCHLHPKKFQHLEIPLEQITTNWNVNITKA